jgi:hypothetical protein
LTDIAKTIVDYLPELSPWELTQFQQELKEWAFAEDHHMHKSWQFPTCQQALRWHELAKKITEKHGRDCYFFLGHVGSGRIETDIINRVTGHLTRDDLEVARMLNSLESSPGEDAELATNSVLSRLSISPPQA